MGTTQVISTHNETRQDLKEQQEWMRNNYILTSLSQSEEFQKQAVGGTRVNTERSGSLSWEIRWTYERKHVWTNTTSHCLLLQGGSVSWDIWNEARHVCVSDCLGKVQQSSVVAHLVRASTRHMCMHLLSLHKQQLHVSGLQTVCGHRWCFCSLQCCDQWAHGAGLEIWGLMMLGLRSGISWRWAWDQFTVVVPCYWL